MLENNKSYLPCATSSLDPKVKHAEDLPLGSRSESLANYDGRAAILFGVVSTFSGIFAVLFVLSLRAALPRRDSVLTSAAVVFSIIASMVPVVVNLITL